MRKTLLTLTFVMCSISIFLASEPIYTKKFTNPKNLSQIYLLAQKNNIKYMKAKATLQSTQENLSIMSGELLPNIKISYTAKDNLLKHDYLEYSRSKNFFQNLTITISQNLFDWPSWNKYRYLDFQRKADMINFDKTQQNILKSISNAYFSILKAQDNLVYAKANKRWNKELLDQTKEKFKIGFKSIIDVKNIRAQYEQAAADLVKAKNDLKISCIKISKFVKEPVNSVKGLSNDFPFNKPKPNNVEKWLEISMNKNLNIIQKCYLVRAAKSGINAAWGLFMPNILLSGTKTFIFDSRKNNSFFSDSKKENLSIQANFNLLNGGSDYAAIRKQKYNEKIAQLVLLQTKIKVESELRTAYLTLISDISKIQAYKQATLAAKTSVSALKTGYRIGTQTIIDLLNQQQLLFQLQQKYSKAKYKYIDDLLNLKLIAGTISSKDIQIINQWLTVDPVNN